MKLKRLKKSSQYLIIFIAGIILVLAGIIILIQEIKESDLSEILFKSVLLLFWILFTVFNFMIYKKEKKKLLNFRKYKFSIR